MNNEPVAARLRVSPDLLRLAADMLDAYADRLGSDTCTDWTPPAYLTPEHLADLSWYAWEANGCNVDERPEPVRNNWIAAHALARMLRNAANRMEADHAG